MTAAQCSLRECFVVYLVTLSSIGFGLYYIQISYIHIHIQTWMDAQHIFAYSCKTHCSLHPECAIRDPKAQAYHLRGPKDGEHRRLPSRAHHAQHAERSPAGGPAWEAWVFDQRVRPCGWLFILIFFIYPETPIIPYANVCTALQHCIHSLLWH